MNGIETDFSVTDFTNTDELHRELELRRAVPLRDAPCGISCAQLDVHANSASSAVIARLPRVNVPAWEPSSHWLRSTTAFVP
jgi:hypothetical protein